MYFYVYTKYQKVKWNKNLRRNLEWWPFLTNGFQLSHALESSGVCVCVYVHSVVSDSLQPHGLPTRLLCPWDFPGKNTGIGCYFLLEWLFLTQGLNPCLICPVLAGGFFTTSATWEVPESSGGLVKKDFWTSRVSDIAGVQCRRICLSNSFLHFTNAAKRPHFQNLS